MSKRIISSILAALLVVALFVGCGSKSAPATETEKQTQTTSKTTTAETTKDPNAEPFTITIGTWCIDDDPAVDKDGSHKAYKEAIAAMFKETYPNAEIQWNLTAGDKYFDVFKAQLASNSAPDVFMHAKDIGILGKGNYCADLSDEPWVPKMLDACKPDVTYQGKVLAIPGQIGGWGCWYNKKIFADNGLVPPKTYSDFLNICETLKSKGIVPIEVGFKDMWPATGFYLAFAPAFLYANDKELLVNITRGTKKITESPEFTDLFTKIEELFKKEYLPKNTLSIGVDQVNNDFGNGKCAMTLYYYAFPGTINGNPEFKDVEIGFFPIPNDKGDAFATFTVDQLISVNSASKYIEQGKRLIAVMRHEEVFGPFIKDKGIPPFKDFKITHTNPAFQEYNDSFTKYPTAYQADAYIPQSYATDMMNLVLKIASGKSFEQADFEKAQMDVERDRNTVVLPE